MIKTKDVPDMTDKAMLWILNDRHLWQMIDDIADDTGNMNIRDAFPQLHKAVTHCIIVNENVDGLFSIEWNDIEKDLKSYVISRRN